MPKTILVIGTLDTNTKELAHLRDRIEKEVVEVLLMDVSCKEVQTGATAEIPCSSVAQETGRDFTEVSQSDKITAVKLMREGAITITNSLVEEGRVHGVMGLGGANGAEIGCAVMRTLPIGLPKLMVTCVASGNTRPYVGAKDIVMFNSIGDVSLNSITKRVINNAARAITHMATQESTEEAEAKPQICMSTFGTTLGCVDRAKALLEEKGFEVIELHASGSGGMALEELVKEGEASAVLDITTSEIVDDLVGGMYSAGPHRLEAASEMGIPQVVSFGALDFGNFGAKETIPKEFQDRHFFFYAPSITLMRTNAEESRILGKRIAEKLNRSKGPAGVIVPLKGFSAVDSPGGKRKTRIDGSDAGEWYDEEANGALIESVRKNLDASKVKLVEVDAHINDPEFADAAVALLLELIKIK
ncbi:MAG: Tm-1-like ATP-binding domain-containing protein [Deltaproteobacteria bacterium]|nr:Tm-1-like ATP-binding domain-containing protein [Deltaproteobacteria bacterium]